MAKTSFQKQLLISVVASVVAALVVDYLRGDPE